jgi:hypothetical protein
MIALGNEYTRRYGKKHLTIEKCYNTLMDLPPGIPSQEWQQPPQCMPDEYKSECSVDAYWNYYEAEKHTVANANETKITRYANSRM